MQCTTVVDAEHGTLYCSAVEHGFYRKLSRTDILELMTVTRASQSPVRVHISAHAAAGGHSVRILSLPKHGHVQWRWSPLAGRGHSGL